MLHLIILSLTILNLGRALAEGTPRLPQRYVVVCFRYDDVSARSPAELELEIVDIFQDVGRSHTFAVIPGASDRNERSVAADTPSASLPASKIALLREAVSESRLEVALHGLTHAIPVGSPVPTEFAGLPLADQISMMQRGRDVLEVAVGTEIQTFVPPYNTYDANTLSALAGQGFRNLSANREGPAVDSGLRVLPSTCSVTDVRRAVEVFRRSGAGMALLVVTYHPFDFEESGSLEAVMTIPTFRKLVNWCAQQNDVEICSLAEAADRYGPSFTPERHAANAGLASSWPLVVDMFFASDALLYWEETKAAQLSRRKRIVLGLWYPVLGLASAALGFCAMRLAPRRLRRLSATACWVAVLLFVACVGYAAWNLRVGDKGKSAMLASGAFAAGVWLSFSLRAPVCRGGTVHGEHGAIR